MYGCEACPAFKTESTDEFLKHAHEVHGYPEPLPPSLSFAALRVVNVTRCEKWHGADSDPWTCADWSNALAGESGELSEASDALIAHRLMSKIAAATGKTSNATKKIRRQETGAVNAGDPSMEALKKNVEAELADVVIYADLLARYFDINLGEAVRAKFNKVSEKYGFPERL